MFLIGVAAEVEAVVAEAALCFRILLYASFFSPESAQSLLWR
jgi:hypothetical protein